MRERIREDQGWSKYGRITTAPNPFSMPSTDSQSSYPDKQNEAGNGTNGMPTEQHSGNSARNPGHMESRSKRKYSSIAVAVANNKSKAEIM